MTKAKTRAPSRRGSTPARRKPYPVWLVTVAAFVLPGSGQMLNGDAIRGITMQFFMLFLAFITYQVTAPNISFIGRIAGGLLVYVFSVLDAYNVARKRARAWERLNQDGAPAQPKGGVGRAQGSSRPGSGRRDMK